MRKMPSAGLPSMTASSFACASSGSAANHLCSPHDSTQQLKMNAPGRACAAIAPSVSASRKSWSRVHAGGLDRRIDPVRRVGRMTAAVAGVATAQVQLDARFVFVQPEVQAALAIKLRRGRAGMELSRRARKAAQLWHRRLVPQGKRHPQVRARRHHHIADAADQVADLLAAPLDPGGLAVEIEVLVAFGESLRRLPVPGTAMPVSFWNRATV